jgi:hypothetical protein
MTGDERYAEVIALLNDPNTYVFGDIHKRIQVLVGRSVWTHEFATDLALANEARTQHHPVDLRAHLAATVEALTDAPVIFVPEETP